ncbi:response regulator [Haliangium sp.]|uniref:response regulator n=1 Tax=Haliangium sp. TaxID=2663208 RepID=UPI003D13C4F5
MRLARRVTAPNPAVVHDGTRQRLRVIKGVSLVVAALGLGAVLFGRPGGRPAFVAMTALALTAWLCSRTTRATLAGVLVILACAVLPYWGLYSPEATTSAVAEIILLLLALQIAGLAMPMAWFLPTALVHVSIVLGLMWHNRDIPGHVTAEMGMYLLAATGLTAIYVAIRGRNQTRLAHQMSELRDNNQALADARREAEAASDMKSRFLANMSHEIRTPLNGVLGLTRVLLGTRLDTQQRRYLELITQSGDALLGLINDILDLSKIEAGMMKTEARAFAVRPLVEQCCAILSERAEDKGLRLSADVATEVPASLVGDPGLIRQVLVNLLGNAIKFTEHGRVQVALAPAGSNRWRFEVSDTGIGIDAAAQARLFESFYQVDRLHGGGTGLGLAICKQLVAQMDGDIGVTSAVGEGSTFWFEVPMQVAQLAAAETPSPSPERLYRDATTRAAAAARVLQSAGSGPTSAPAALAPAPDDAPSPDASVPVAAARDHAPSPDAGVPVAPARDDAPSPDASVVVAAARDDAPSPEPAATEPAAGNGAGSATAVLVVDDNPINRLVAARLLERLGCAVNAVESGDEALAAIQAGRYELVFMDCEMPDMDGYETTARIRREEGDERRLTIVAMTAHAMADDRQRCLDAGMDDYLSKPIRLEVLAGLLDDWRGSRP